MHKLRRISSLDTAIRLHNVNVSHIKRIFFLSLTIPQESGIKDGMKFLAPYSGMYAIYCKPMCFTLSIIFNVITNRFLLILIKRNGKKYVHYQNTGTFGISTRT